MPEIELKIDTLCCIVKLTDGRVYNVLLKKETQDILANTINLCEGGIQLLDTPIEGIEITTPKKGAKKKRKPNV